jgi:hypothetical protein
MTADGNILAAGITPGMVFGIAVVVMWVFAAVMNKKKPDELKKPSRAAQDLAEARRRIREQQNANKPAITPRIEQQRAKNQKKKQKQQQQQQQVQPPALPMISGRPGSSPITPNPDSRPAQAFSQEIGTAPVARRNQSETAKNIRLMLQKNGLKEAFVLGEVLGKPVTMRGD